MQEKQKIMEEYRIVEFLVLTVNRFLLFFPPALMALPSTHISMENKLEGKHKKGKRIHLQKRHLKEPTEAQGTVNSGWETGNLFGMALVGCTTLQFE